MNSLEKYLPFVKAQIEFQEKMADKYVGEEWRQRLHIQSYKTFFALYEDIQKTSSYINELEQRPKVAITASTDKKISITFEDIKGLPEDLVKELSLSNADKTELYIQEIINNYGGFANIDRILIDLYKKTGEIFKRNALTARLYRMQKEEKIFSVPGKKGIYSTIEAADSKNKSNDNSDLVDDD